MVKRALSWAASGTLALFQLFSLGQQPLRAGTNWPLWESYTNRFLDPSGRIVDRDANDRTTSEAQSYALFFALVSDDRPRFDQILSWTEQNLAHGTLAATLPAWLWNEKDGHWGIGDENSASDSDVWIAYTLLEAGRIWGERRFHVLGEALARRIVDEEVRDVPGLGPMLLPGRTGFYEKNGFCQLNASYLPLQILLGLGHHLPDSPWERIAARVPRVIQGSAQRGFVMDWIAFHAGQGFSLKPVPQKEPMASYDAIRVYLWAGMLASSSPHRKEVLASLFAMPAYLKKNDVPPAEVTETGDIKDPRGSVGFSAAVIPLLSALNDSKALECQRRRLRSERNASTGLYGANPKYYDQNLVLFATGWDEGRFRFNQHGWLERNTRAEMSLGSADTSARATPEGAR
jgi:endoglucanase